MYEKEFIHNCNTFFISLSLSGQQQAIPEKKFFISLDGGPAFPTGDFASKDLNKQQAAFAKTGFNLNLNFAYEPNEIIGLTGTMFYTKHSVDLSSVESNGYTSLMPGHWQYYGIMIGPILTLPATEKLLTDLKILAGAANVNMPQIGYNNTVVTEEVWAVSFAMQLSGDLRYYLSKQLFMVMNVDYNVMKPKFNFTDANGESRSASQGVESVAVSLGLGVSF